MQMHNNKVCLGRFGIENDFFVGLGRVVSLEEENLGSLQFGCSQRFSFSSGV